MGNFPLNKIVPLSTLQDRKVVYFLRFPNCDVTKVIFICSRAGFLRREKCVAILARKLNPYIFRTQKHAQFLKRIKKILIKICDVDTGNSFTMFFIINTVTATKKYPG